VVIHSSVQEEQSIGKRDDMPSVSYARHMEQTFQEIGIEADGRLKDLSDAHLRFVKARDVLVERRAAAREALTKLRQDEQAIEEEIGRYPMELPPSSGDGDGEGADMELLLSRLDDVVVSELSTKAAELLDPARLKDRLEYTRDMISRLETMRDALVDVRNATSVIYSEKGPSQTEVAQSAGLSSTAVANIRSDFGNNTSKYSSSPMGIGKADKGAESQTRGTGEGPQVTFPPQINEVQTDTLRAVLLDLMKQCIDKLPDGKARHSLNEQASNLGDELRRILDGGDNQSSSWVEDRAAIGHRLNGIDKIDIAFQLLIEVASAAPWATVAPRLKSNEFTSFLSLRERQAEWVADQLSGIDSQDSIFVVRNLEANLPDWITDKKKNYWPIVAAGAATTILAIGLAGPVGAFVGAGMGLSGAAATSAGLAALGGGSLAAGGLGMAGGTALIAGAGAGMGAAGAASVPRLWRPRLSRMFAEMEAAKLTCLVLALDERGTRDPEAQSLAVQYRNSIDLELAALRERVKRSKSSVPASATQEGSSGRHTDDETGPLNAEERRRLVLLAKIAEEVRTPV